MPHDDKPRHLQPEYGEQFRDLSVAAAYSSRPPYPREVFSTLLSLMHDAPRVVLELGAGTGDITWGLAEHVERIDAVEPSAPMRAAAARVGADAAGRVRWISETAETFTPDGPYTLAIAAESLHWMNWTQVLPNIARHLAPRGVLAIVTTRAWLNLPWSEPLRRLVSEYSTNRDYVDYDIIEELEKRKLFRELGRQTCISEPFTQAIERYIESFHSRNGFSRERMGEAASRAFDAKLHALVSDYCSDGRVTSPVASTVVWGQPLEHRTG